MKAFLCPHCHAKGYTSPIAPDGVGSQWRCDSCGVVSNWEEWIPEILAPLLERFNIVPTVEERWKKERPHTAVCKNCGREFYPLPTPGGVANTVPHVCERKV